MLKNYLYLNILFIFGLILYFFTLKFDLDLYQVFYLFFSIFSITIPLLFLLSGFKYEDKEESSAFNFLFWGFFLYGITNLVWFFNEWLVVGVPLDYLNILFLAQVFSKNYFLKYLFNNKIHIKTSKFLSNIFSINLGILLLSIIFSNWIPLNESFFDFYFILESIFSIFILTFYMKGILTKHIDLKYFTFGNVLWLIGDILFLLETLSGVTFMGNFSDFIFYIGFYLMLHSVMFKNYNFWEKFNLHFEKNLSFS